MNVLVLGSDPRSESIRHCLTKASGHRVKCRPDSNIESTNVSAFDALVCAGPVRPLFNEIREFLSIGKPVTVIPSAVQGSDTAYELLAVDEETGGRLGAGFIHRYEPAWREWRERVKQEAGQVLQLIQIERRLPGTSGSGVLSFQEFDEALLSDADLLRWLGSEYTQVTCLYTGATDTGASRATVTLAGDSKPEATWTLQADLDADGTRRGSRVSVSGSSLSIDGAGDGSTSAEECAAGLLADLEKVSRGEPPQVGWMDAVRAFDVIDAARRSVKRRRTVEISAGEVSERGQFKTKMTALGCALLSFTLFGVILALLIGAVFDPRDAMQRQSEAAGFVLEQDAFVAESAELTDRGLHQLRDVSERLRETPAEIIVESISPDSMTARDEERRDVVLEFLREEKDLELNSRVVVRPLAGQWFQRLMTGVWVVVFLPLGLFLILQMLIVVTRSSERGDESLIDES